MNIEIKEISESQELAQAYSIRNEVFCIEQNVPYSIEMDEYDSSASHILAVINKKPVGTARWRTTNEGLKLERFAVLKEYRRKGVGEALLNYLLDRMKDQSNVYLNAQESVIRFYEKFGFEVTGDRFYEASIPHKKMVLKK